MSANLPTFHILHGLALGVGLAVLGLLALLGGSLLSKRTARYASFLMLVLLGSATLAAYWFDPTITAVVLAVLFVLWSAGLLLRSQLLQSATQVSIRSIAHPRLQAAVLLALAPACFGASLYIDECQIQSELVPYQSMPGAPTLVEVDIPVFTDDGKPLPIYYAADSAHPLTAQSEQQFLQRPEIRERVIRTGEACIETNCHGWVFAAGYYWVKGSQVEQILTGNGYQEVTHPQVNDVAVYRDETGQIAHTALVRMVHEDGTILLESKWGQFGRFLHGPSDQTYAPTPKYYHTNRRTHILRGLDGGYKPTPAGVIAHAG